MIFSEKTGVIISNHDLVNQDLANLNLYCEKEKGMFIGREAELKFFII